jgi:DNA helicase-2/ATP-dependent DNA helicase PcrA
MRAKSIGKLENLEINHLTKLLEKLRQTLRQGQQNLADWQGGRMAVSAVPGAGKSHSLSVAAALAIARYQLNRQRQLIIVTYTRSAAASIKKKVGDRLKELSLPIGGFEVHTLHGLALNIAKRHLELSGLELETSTLISPNNSHRIILAAIEQWIVERSELYQLLLAGSQNDSEATEQLRRHTALRADILPALANTVIREAKSSGLSPQELYFWSEKSTDPYRLLEVAASLYEEYDRIARSQSFIDYDDMILGALRVLNNREIRQLWQERIFAVFEDEAQDSSPLQEKLISILATAPHNLDLEPNLIRVGDPNQAINSTFTPADPVYFNWFCQTCATNNNLTTMDRSGRSSKIILQAANYVLQWVNERQLTQAIATQKDLNNTYTPFRQQEIQPVDPGDPQPDANPEPIGKGVEIHQPRDIYHTVELIQQRLIQEFQINLDRNAAILVRENRQGRFLAEQLAYLPKKHQIQVYEVSETERYSQIPEEILKLFKFIERPHSTFNLKTALEVLEARSLIATQDFSALAIYPEQFLYPTILQTPHQTRAEEARRLCCELLNARMELPTYQLIVFLGMTLKYEKSELATLEKLADRIERQVAGRHTLKKYLEILEELVNSERFEGVDEGNEDRYTRPNQVTIITMHKAKGLDWDLVFIPFLHQDIIPGQPWVPNAAKFLGDFSLSEVARAQIRTAVHSRYLDPEGEIIIPSPLKAWEEAGRLKTAEEFRLLYVAMTRAKRLLWMSAEEKGPFRWSIFKSDAPKDLSKKEPAEVLLALKQFLALSNKLTQL